MAFQANDNRCGHPHCPGHFSEHASCSPAGRLVFDFPKSKPEEKD